MNIDRLLPWKRLKKQPERNLRDLDEDAYFFTFENVRYRAQSFYNENVQERTLLALPDGRLFLAEWSTFFVPPAIKSLRSLPTGGKVPDLPTVTVTYAKKSTWDSRHILRLE